MLSNLCTKQKEMNTFIWTLQGLMAFVFMFSGINKAYFDEKTLVEKGQTGVEGLSSGLIKFIGISEILGAIGLILPSLLNIYPVLTPIAAISMGAIMIPAGIIHFRRKEHKNVLLNIAILVLCGAVAWGRL